jgi:hypothetical protein
MFIGNKETQKAAAQATIEALNFLNRAHDALRRLSLLVPPDDKVRHLQWMDTIDATSVRVFEVHNDDCRNAFTEE